MVAAFDLQFQSVLLKQHEVGSEPASFRVGSWLLTGVSLPSEIDTFRPGFRVAPDGKFCIGLQDHLAAEYARHPKAPLPFDGCLSYFLLADEFTQRNALKCHVGLATFIQNADGLLVDHRHAGIARAVVFVKQQSVLLRPCQTSIRRSLDCDVISSSRAVRIRKTTASRRRLCRLRDLRRSGSPCTRPARLVLVREVVCFCHVFPMSRVVHHDAHRLFRL